MLTFIDRTVLFADICEILCNNSGVHKGLIGYQQNNEYKIHFISRSSMPMLTIVAQ